LGREVPGSDKVRETLLECLAQVLKLAGPWDSHQFLNIINHLMKVFELENNKLSEPKIIAVGTLFHFSLSLSLCVCFPCHFE
jgi:hypothetical protein